MRAQSKLNRKYGFIPSLPNKNNFKLKDLFSAVVPAVLEPAISMKEFCGPIRNQGQLGCCTGEGTAGALKLLMNKNSYRWPYYPSTLGIYYGARVIENTVDSDAGAMIDDCFSVMNQQGVIPEDSNADWSWPFSSTDDRWKENPPSPCWTDALKHKVIKYAQLDQDSVSIKTALSAGFPVVIGISVYESFESDQVAQTGVIPMPGPLEQLLGGHCMYLWGYGNYDATHFDGANSWGADWGDGGNYHIPFDYLTDPDLCSDLWAVELIT
jgi:hypothetical protein